MKQAFLEAHPELLVAIEEAKLLLHGKNSFVHDVLSKLQRYGSISQRQIDALLSSLKKDHEREAQRALELTEVKGEAPVGRQTVTGRVLSIKNHVSLYGTSFKMLVKLENNSKVWLTVPSTGEGIIGRDSIITFKATFEQSKDDKSFGFGKRPQLIEKKEGATA